MPRFPLMTFALILLISPFISQLQAAPNVVLTPSSLSITETHKRPDAYAPERLLQTILQSLKNRLPPMNMVFLGKKIHDPTTDYSGRKVITTHHYFSLLPLRGKIREINLAIKAIESTCLNASDVICTNEFKVELTPLFSVHLPYLEAGANQLFPGQGVIASVRVAKNYIGDVTIESLMSFPNLTLLKWLENSFSLFSLKTAPSSHSVLTEVRGHLLQVHQSILN